MSRRVLYWDPDKAISALASRRGRLTARATAPGSTQLLLGSGAEARAGPDLRRPL